MNANAKPYDSRNNSYSKNQMAESHVRRLHNNMRVYASRKRSDGSYNIYLDCSGHSVMLVPAYHNRMLYVMLTKGMPLSELYRWTPSDGYGGSGRFHNRRTGQSIENAVDHLKEVIDCYIDYTYPDAA